jgi:hypothetical protein
VPFIVEFKFTEDSVVAAFAGTAGDLIARPGEPGTDEVIAAALKAHPGGLTGKEIMAELKLGRDAVLEGIKLSSEIQKRGKGKSTRYYHSSLAPPPDAPDSIARSVDDQSPVPTIDRSDDSLQGAK